MYIAWANEAEMVMLTALQLAEHAKGAMFP